MYPVLFQTGNLTIYSFSAVIVLAVLLSAWLSYLEAKKENVSLDVLLEALVLVLVFGLLGARLFFIALNPAGFIENFPLSLFCRFEGLSFFGGLFSGLTALYFWSSKKKVSFLKLGDLFALALMPGLGLGKIGCFLNGCCAGKPSSVPWALPALVADPVLRHPVQLYTAFGALLIFLALKYLKKTKPINGFVLICMLALFGLLSFITGFFSACQPVFLSLCLNQWAGLGLALFTALLLAVYFFLLPAQERPSLKLPRLKTKRKYRRERRYR